MLRTFRAICFIVVLASGLLNQSLLATTVAVGPSTCKPSLVHFSTIQAAVNGSPFGTTIDVCPGTYPEQVVISQPLTLVGVTDGTGDSAVITVPGAGLVQNANSSLAGPVSAQLLVENTVGVTIQNVAIDGTGSGCPTGANRVFGLEFYFVGVPVDGTAGGKIQNVVVRNVPNTCVHGDGIVVDNSFITVSSNEVHDIGITPILVLSGAASVTYNNIQNALNGVVTIGTSTTTSISNNSISNLTQNLGFESTGLWVDGGAAKVTNNTVATASQASFGSLGINLPFTTSGTTATGNRVNAVFNGLSLFGSAGTTVQSNTFSNTSSDAILDQFSGGGNIITRNTVNEAPLGIFEFSPSNDTLTPNSYFNVVVTIDPGPVSSGTTATD